MILFVCLVAFLVSFLLTVLFVPVCKTLALRWNYLDIPKSEGHKQHSSAIPLLGGVAMFCGWFATLVLGGIVLLCRSDVLPVPVGNGAFSCLNELAAIVVCALLFLLLGLYDDKRPMRAWRKFLFQFVIIVLLILWSGMRISLFLPWSFVSFGVTAFWLLFLVNAINFFDNMDGLASGTAAIAFGFFAVCSIWNGQYFVGAFCACSMGAAVGFWLFNRYPAKIFMGDGGSHFLGILLGIASIKVTYYNPEMSGTHLAVLLPLFILAVPVFDAFAVILIRLKNHKPIYVGDNNHISHRFLHMGCTRKQSVLLVHLMCLIIGLGALPILNCSLKTAVILFLQGLGFFAVLTLIQFIGAKVQSRNTSI